MPVIPPDDVRRLLETRLMRLDAEIAAVGGVMDEMAKRGMPYLFAIESDYARALKRAEREFVAGLIDKIGNGTLDGVDVWRRAHESGELPSDGDWERAIKHLRSVN
jgi:hypothetical protein